jgi:hypothetical protein
VDFAEFLSPPDAERANWTFAMLLRHRTDPLVLTGGMAIELHQIRLGFPAQLRPLNDIDFVVDSFDDIPTTLASDLVFRHVHPNDSPGRTLLQCVDSRTSVRVDFFRTCGETLQRATEVEFAGETVRLVSPEDLTARTARLCMDLAVNMPTPRKHTRDFLRLLPLVDIPAMESVWSEHRKAIHPLSFSSAANLLLELIATRRELQIVPVNSRNVTTICNRCENTSGFPVADAGVILSLLGYC